MNTMERMKAIRKHSANGDDGGGDVVMKVLKAEGAGEVKIRSRFVEVSTFSVVN